MEKTTIILLACISIIVCIYLFLTNDKLELMTVDEMTAMNADIMSRAGSVVFSKEGIQIPNLTVSGPTVLNGGLTVATGKPVTFGGDVTITGKLNGGAITQNQPLPTDPTFTTLQTTGRATIGESLVSGNQTVNGMSNLNGGLTVGNKSYFGNDVNVNGKLLVGGVALATSGIAGIQCSFIVTDMASRGLGLTTDKWVCCIGGIWPNPGCLGAILWVDGSGQWCYKQWGAYGIVVLAIPKTLCSMTYKTDSAGSYTSYTNVRI